MVELLGPKWPIGPKYENLGLESILMRTILPSREGLYIVEFFKNLLFVHKALSLTHTHAHIHTIYKQNAVHL